MSISLNEVSYVYTPGTAFETRGVNSVSLEIADGEFVGIMGKTGCGKSTLIQLIAGLLTPAAGKVFIDGEDINSKKYDRHQLRRKVGVVFQYPEYQLFETTVERDVAFALRRSGAGKDEICSAVRKALETVGFNYDEVRDKSPLGFSGGEKRRIAIAGVLAAEPKILILDEPIAGLDPLGREAFLGIMDKLNKSGVTILMVSHNADALAEHAGRILVLKDGEIFRDGNTMNAFFDYDDLISNGIGVPQVREVAHMLGLPKSTVTYKQLIAGLKTICGGGQK